MLEDSVRETNGIVSSILSDEEISAYEMIYDTIDQHQCLKLWMTMSPKPLKDVSHEDHIRRFLRDFRPASILMEQFILVFELNEKDQIHFHFFCCFKDLRSKITFTKKYTSKWYHEAIIKPIWGKAPKHGFKYLIKQYDYMFNFLDNYPPLITKFTIDQYRDVFDVFSDSDSD